MPSFRKRSYLPAAIESPLPALQKTDQLLAGKSGDPALYVQTGELLSRSGHVAHALQCYRAAEGKSWLGKIHLLQAEKEKALECFERAVKLDPKHLGAYYQTGLLYARNGEQEKSRDAMEMQRQLNAQMHKGLVALRMP